MTDIELLEAAAKAAGINVWRGKNFQADSLYRNSSPGSSVITGIEWNPITNDGDALRLSVKLQIDIDWSHKWSDGTVQAYSEGSHHCAEEPIGGDPYAATRRAIVRAAAEIGRNMK